MTETTSGKRIIDGLKAAICYAKGDKSKGERLTITPSSGCVFNDLHVECKKEKCHVCG